MPESDSLRSFCPVLASQLPRIPLATLPTAVGDLDVHFCGKRSLSVKYDNLTGDLYGGNKVRKLEYIFARAKERGAQRIATFGAVGSNHALATALYAMKSGFRCTCFLSHQARTPEISTTLRKHLEIGTEIVRFGGAYHTRIRTLSRYLWNRRAWVIPMGGSSWLGTVGFVRAGLELAEQIRAGEVSQPERICVGSGTMGTAAGLALGLALAGVDCEVHAVRVSDLSIMNEEAFSRLVHKTALMMRLLDDSIPRDLADRTRVRIRHDFFGPGYARGTDATDEAIAFAADQLDLGLETTYTGKTMAALLADWRNGTGDERVLYWHTYNSAPVEAPGLDELDLGGLPEEFLKYVE
jgi:1-aminocyclopropane-1-carboxylate deaminase/D-cysteine desulfhydrase-like pyridoxal-dependent ACC family enzyme